MVIMWVLLGVALAFVVMLRLLIMRQRRFDRLLAERRAQVARARTAREAAERASARQLSADGGGPADS